MKEGNNNNIKRGNSKTKKKLKSKKDQINELQELREKALRLEKKFLDKN